MSSWQKSEGKSDKGGLNQKGRDSYNKETGGNLQAPVTESNPTGKRKKRRKSFCARMCGMKKKNTGSEAKKDPDSRINKSLRRWKCKCANGNTIMNITKTAEKYNIEITTNDWISIGIQNGWLKKAKKMSKNPCWKGYEMIGTKKKKGKEVPNCVPKK